MRPYAHRRGHHNATYRLYAVVEHSGSDNSDVQGGGHYTAKVRANYGGHVPGVADGSWWSANDGRVAPVANEEHLRNPAAAYMLFYERCA
jgi:ubiquitin C-terminal hydrolase